jgi:hypothetical protein
MMIVRTAGEPVIPEGRTRGFIRGFPIHAIGANAMRSSSGMLRNDE